ncbi:PhzF family phenazine biosynthesis protein [Yoonia sediminilitoris]|uniref:PhzF family phenazine biosynthesis protein n=1 Tax=Yoonia sediminilitoris TaxID=1286148 RepID=A0A2T6KRX6_9RHOB|nr:PhzF family phenazine biosynthesis protein [Yoonia sediminilitoris]PUB19316.1 PhzF family phenazine biosynthesis protein [Yoonia sediminilitoris]RCW99484.1 PhzF family phenazine biosynthesis protein [Yoonia sediminilitoris]
MLVELTDRSALAACQPDTGAIREAADRYPAGIDFSIYAYVPEGDTIHARMFAPLDEIPEDPATGSAAATLAVLLAQLTGKPQNIRIIQGEQMGRRSVIQADSDGETCIISGQARRVMMGRLV